MFRSPVLFKPYAGRDQLLKVLQSAERVLGGGGRFRYVHQLEDPGDRVAMLEFATEVDGKQVEGIDKLTFDEDGRITEVKVLIRPVSASRSLRPGWPRSSSGSGSLNLTGYYLAVGARQPERPAKDDAEPLRNGKGTAFGSRTAGFARLSRVRITRRRDAAPAGARGGRRPGRRSRRSGRASTWRRSGRSARPGRAGLDIRPGASEAGVARERRLDPGQSRGPRTPAVRAALPTPGRRTRRGRSSEPGSAGDARSPPSRASSLNSAAAIPGSRSASASRESPRAGRGDARQSRPLGRRGPAAGLAQLRTVNTRQAHRVRNQRDRSPELGPEARTASPEALRTAASTAA